MRRDKVLVVSPNWMGDALFLTPAIRALRRALPGAHLVCLSARRCARVFENNPYLNAVVDRARGEKFDAALFFQPSCRRSFWTMVTGVPERVGFARRGKAIFLNRVFQNISTPIHRVNFFLELVRQWTGAAPEGRHLDFFTTPDDERVASASLDLLKDYCVVHAGGNWDLKRWPVAYFSAWIQKVLAESDLNVVLCGSGNETALTDEIGRTVKSERVVSVCGKTTLGSLAVILKHARFLLSNDSGPLHLAGSQRTPVIGLYGPTALAYTGPVSEGAIVIQKNVGCEVPCYFRSCNYRVCMDWITPEEVFEKSKEFLK